MRSDRHKKRINLKKFVPFVIVCIILIAALAFGAVKLVEKIKTTRCEHSYENGVCINCGKECKHSFAEGVCTVCGSKDPEYIPPDDIRKISLACVGDAMAHITNLRSQYNQDGTYYKEENQNCHTDGSFDFAENYTWIKDYVSKADLAMVNIETTFAGGPDYSGSPARFNAPDVLAANLKDAGFDLAFTCNNHSLDRKIDGLKRTVSVLKQNGFTVVGTRESKGDDRSVVIEVNGVKIGVVAYTYETILVNGRRTLNGAYMPEGATDYLNSYRFVGSGRNGATAHPDDKALIAEQIEWCRSNGAEIIIGYFHWDSYNEYVGNVTALEKDLASFAAEKGVDIIFGSHPHVVQKIEMLEISNAGKTKKVPVFYSLGNFISNQNKESFADLGDSNGALCQEELMAWVEISYNKTNGDLRFEKISAIPLYVARYKGTNTGSRWEYRIFPLIGDYKQNEDLIASKQQARADQALSHITEVIGEQYIYK